MKGTKSRFGGAIGKHAVAACVLGVAGLVLSPGCTRGRSPADGVANLDSAPSAPAAGVSAARSEAKPAPAGESVASPAPSKVIAYYFHRTLRCHSCLAIEKLAWQAIEAGFIDAMGEGKLEWRPMNLDQAGNAHFEKDFELTTQSLVLAKVRSGETIEWKNLADVWDLLDDPAAFERYVRDEVAKYLK